ncbi:MAG: hypothetical protein V1647_00750 [Pseudomonadota bacterium]
MRYIIIITTLIFGFQSGVFCKPVKKSKPVKRRQIVDLEGIDVQGLIDRPQTLYILKKSEISFKDNIDEFDYINAIIDSTYKEPF